AVRNACGLSNTLATTAAPISAPGLLLLEDDFDYAASQPLTSNGWNPAAGAASTTATATGNLPFGTYPQGAALSSLPAATSSQVSLVAGAAGPLYRSGTARPATATTLYAAAVVNFSATQNAGDYFLAFANAANAASSAPSYRSRVYAARASATTFTFQLGLADEVATPDPAATAFSLNTNYLLVLKTETSASNAETVSLYVLPAGTDLSTEPVAPLITKTGATTLAAPLNAVLLRPDGSANATLTLDGIRLATGWGAAAGQPFYTAAGATIGAGSYYSLTANNADIITPLGAVYVEGSLSLSSGLIASTAAAPLTLYPGTSVAGGSATSYVSGPLSRATGAGAATTTFPIGCGANYRPLVLTATAQASPATYVATQTEGNAGQSFSAGNGLGTAPLRRVSTQRAYSLTTGNPASGFSGTITLPFEPNDYVNNPADAGLVVAKRDALAADPADNNKWTNLGRSASTGAGTGPGGAAGSGTLTSAPFTSFSDFTLGATNDISSSNALTVINPLPVTLSYFAATRTAGGVQVAWATASEQSSDYFAVERSLDGRTFASTARVAAHGTTAQGHAYASLDAAAPAALLYYRLRQVDFAGTVAYSPVATVAALDGVLAGFTLAPNPAHTSLSFGTALPTAYTVRTALGQLVRSGTSAAGPNSLLISDLPAGLYLFELHSAAGRVVRRFTKE
ncbi:MAG: T9SS type A sorting domain-containing protein, partial [Hymenobacter sp.]